MFWCSLQNESRDFFLDKHSDHTFCRKAVSVAPRPNQSQMKKLLQSRFIPVALACIGVLSQLPTAVAATAVAHNTLYDGVTGPIGGQCVSPQCDTEDGCSWITNQYNDWQPGHGCTGGSGGPGGSECVHTLKVCREQYYYTLRGCAGAISQWNTYMTGGC